MENRLSPCSAAAPCKAAGACDQSVAESQPLQAAPAAQQVPRRDIRVGDAIVRIDQHQRDRRVLHHGIEQQFTLHEVRALLAQGRRQFIVRRHQFAEFIVAIGDQRQAEIPFAVARHGARQRAQHLLDRPHDRAMTARARAAATPQESTANSNKGLPNQRAAQALTAAVIATMTINNSASLVLRLKAGRSRAARSRAARRTQVEPLHAGGIRPDATAPGFAPPG